MNDALATLDRWASGLSSRSWSMSFSAATGFRCRLLRGHKSCVSFFGKTADEARCLAADALPHLQSPSVLIVDPEYQAQRNQLRAIWSHMIARCTDPDSKAFKNYGGRGITVCAEWFRFENFFSDMYPRHSAQHSLDRKDNNGSYEPRNCRWATRREQALNRTDTRLFVFRGESLSLPQIAEACAVSVVILRKRLGKGMSLESAIAKPIQVHRRATPELRKVIANDIRSGVEPRAIAQKRGISPTFVYSYKRALLAQGQR